MAFKLNPLKLHNPHVFSEGRHKVKGHQELIIRVVLSDGAACSDGQQGHLGSVCGFAGLLIPLGAVNVQLKSLELTAKKVASS